MSDTKPYVIQQGDYLAKLAFKLGFDAAPVWSSTANEALRTLRKSPDVLLPGDILQIPASSAATTSLSPNTSNAYVAQVPLVNVLLVLGDRDGNRFTDEPCEVMGLSGAGAPEAPTSTDGSGTLMLRVPVTLREVEVHLPRKNVTMRVMVGDMDPEDERSGIQKRLQNLGFGYFFPGEDPDRQLEAALRAFQSSHGLEPTGAIDDATREAILGSYGL